LTRVAPVLLKFADVASTIVVAFSPKGFDFFKERRYGFPIEMPVYDAINVEQKSRADFAPDIELPLSMLTATDNIMLGNHDQKSCLEIKIGNHAEQYCINWCIRPF
jgi:hypothetical protein